MISIISAYSVAMPSDAMGPSIFITVIAVIIGLAIGITPYFISASLAQKKGFSVGLWLIATWFLSWIAVIVLLILDPAPGYRSRSGGGATGKYYNGEPHEIITKTENTYEAFKCSRCGEMIKTRRCGYCGQENDVSKLKKTRSGVLTKSMSAARRRVLPTNDYWSCSCGAKNSPSASECSVCFAPNPHK